MVARITSTTNVEAEAEVNNNKIPISLECLDRDNQITITQVQEVVLVQQITKR